MKYKLFIVLTLMLSNISLCSGQDDQIRVKAYTSADGLSEVVHSFIMMDSLGYIWTNGTNEVHRFDGKVFRNYSIAIASEGQKENLNIHRLYCSPENEVIICSSAGAFILERDTDKFISIMEGFPHHADQTLPELTAAVKVENILYFSAFVGLYSYDMKNGLWQYHDLTPEIVHKNNHHSEKVFWCLGIDKYDSNHINIFGRNKYVSFNAKDQKIARYNDIKEIDEFQVSTHNFVQTGKNNFFMSTYGRGIVKYNSKTNVASILYNESSVGHNRFNFRVSHSNCLIGSEIVSTSYNDYMQFVDTLTGKARPFIRMSEFSFDYTTFGDEIYWGSNIKGLIKVYPSLEKKYKIKTPSGVRLARSVVNKAGELALMQLSDSKLYRFDTSNETLSPLNKKALNNCLFNDSYSNEFIFRNQKNRLEIYDGNTIELLRTLTDTFNGRIFDFEVDERSYLIINEEKLKVYNRQSGLLERSYAIPSKYFEYRGLSALNINPINDTLIILQNQQYTISLDLNSGSLHEHSEIRNLGSIDISSIDGVNFYTSLGRSGLAKLTYDHMENQFHRETVEWSKDSYELSYTAKQNDSLLWLISKDHLRVFNMKSEAYDLIYALPVSPSNVLWYVTFTEAEAIFSNQNTLFKISLERSPIRIHSVNLEHVDIGDERTKNFSHRTFPHTQKVLGFEWSAPCYQTFEHLQFYTKLEGRDDRWVPNDEKNTKLYLGLTPGKYSFKVKATMSGATAVESTLYEFEIGYPWYSSWWFIILALTFGLLIGYLIYKYRVNSITEKTRLDKHIAQLELKAIKAQLNPHFIFNSLNSIKRMIEINDNHAAIEYLLLFSSMIRNVLDLSDRKSITLREELEFSTKYLKMEKMRFDKNFDFEIHIENDDILDDYALPSMILQPHLENAIWHGIMPLRDRKGKLYLDIVDGDDSIIIQMEDNGIGRAASNSLRENNKGHIHKSKGQSLSIDRLKLSSLTREQEITTEIIDKDPAGPNPGTIIKIKLKKSN